MYTLLLSYHQDKPIVANKFELSKTKLIKEGLLGHKFFALTTGDREHCISAWEILKAACDKQDKNHNLN